MCFFFCFSLGVFLVLGGFCAGEGFLGYVHSIYSTVHISLLSFLNYAS